ncbi:MAG: DUF4352 domain-containing protein [Bryobacteraceae bacterium]|jgi:hypothetical protein
MRKLGWFGVTLALGGFLGGCSSQGNSRHDPKVYHMGEPVRTGPLVYTVLDTEWLDQIGDPLAPRLPRNHFLSVRISVTNAGSATSGVPLLTIVNSHGVAFAEIDDAKDLPEWLGYIRSVRSAETLHGRLLFDAPTGDYSLQVADDADRESQSTATIRMPLELTHP